MWECKAAICEGPQGWCQNGDASSDTTSETKIAPKSRKRTRRPQFIATLPQEALPAVPELWWRTSLGDEWFDALRETLVKPEILQCLAQVEAARRRSTVFPPPESVFHAFKLTPLNEVKVVIVGQDPYHGPGQAMGLAFSVPPGIRIPPTLVNIFKEVDQFVRPSHGDLTPWANQGVLLLNMILTVEANKPLSHRYLGWEHLTGDVIRVINQRCDSVIFLLWGQHARKLVGIVDMRRHKVLEAGHPSPLSVRQFAGCNHFNLANEFLTRNGRAPVNWKIPD